MASSNADESVVKCVNFSCEASLADRDKMDDSESIIN